MPPAGTLLMLSGERTKGGAAMYEAQAACHLLDSGESPFIANLVLSQPPERFNPGNEAMLFKDRADAGRSLAARLTQYADKSGTLVLGLARGGVPVAFEVAQALHAPLDVFIVRKLGVPGQEELAMGAIAPGGIMVLNPNIMNRLNIPDRALQAAVARETKELARREQAYRGSRPPLDVNGQSVILIDDGLATGSTMRAAIGALRKQRASRLVVAVPVGAPETCGEIGSAVDELICLTAPSPFYGVGRWYERFPQTTDEEVQRLLRKAQHFKPRGTGSGPAIAADLANDPTR